MSFEVVADFRMEYCQQSLELIEFNFQDLELIGKKLFESILHQILEHTVGSLLVLGFYVEIACDVVHPLAVTDFSMIASVSTE